MPDATFAPWSLYFGRFERYKGLDVMLNAQRVIAKDAHHRGMVLAGGGNFGVLWPAPLPQGVSVLNRHIDSDEGRRLFQTCGILVLPYTGATQSALPATAYAFGKPVIVSTSGALPEVVQAGVTGWVVPAGNAEMLADCLATALDNPNCLAAAGAAGRRWYEEERCRQRVAMVRFYSTIKNVN